MSNKETAGKWGLCSGWGCKPECPGCWKGLVGMCQLMRQWTGEGGAGTNKGGIHRKGYKTEWWHANWDWSVCLSGWALHLMTSFTCLITSSHQTFPSLCVCIISLSMPCQCVHCKVSKPRTGMKELDGSSWSQTRVMGTFGLEPAWVSASVSVATGVL